MTRNRQQGSVLLLTLFLVVLASFALSRFIEKAYSEILAEAVYTERDRLRMEAYSALETTVAVLYNVARMDQQLYSPEQGWGDPLEFAGVQLSDDLDVRVEFIDEMGKISLPSADRDRLMRLFEVLDFDAIDSQELTDALTGWMSRQEEGNSFATHHLDYERAELPYAPPYRSLNSLYELAAVAGFRDAFFNAQGDPNERFYQLASLVSLYRFNTINVNSASPAVLRIWSDVGEQEADGIESHRQQITTLKPFFENMEEAQAQLGIPLGEGYGVATQCLRVRITVSDGMASFVLSAVVAPSSRADALRPPSGLNPPRADTPSGEGGQDAPSQASRRPSSPRGGANNQQPIPYPYRFLEIRENEAIL